MASHPGPDMHVKHDDDFAVFLPVSPPSLFLLPVLSPMVVCVLVLANIPPSPATTIFVLVLWLL